MARRPTPLYGRSAPHKRPRCVTPLQLILDAKGWSKFYVAEMIGCDPKMVGLWASGRRFPSGFYILRMAEKGIVPSMSWTGTDHYKMLVNNTQLDWEKWREKRREERRRNWRRQARHA